MPQLSPTLGFMFMMLIFFTLLILVFNSGAGSSFISGSMTSPKSKYSKKFIMF